jgi:hypothetical protein
MRLEDGLKPHRA